MTSATDKGKTPAIGYYPIGHGAMFHPVFGKRRRRLVDWECYCWLVDNAAFGPERVVVANRTAWLKRGQISHSLTFMADAWGWSQPAVRRLINRLARVGMVIKGDLASDLASDPASDLGQTILTICIYEEMSLQIKESDLASDLASDPASDLNLNKVRIKELRKKKTPPSVGEGVSAQGNLLETGAVVAFRIPDEQLAIDAYNAMASETGLPKAVGMSPERRTQIKARLKQVGGLEGWDMVLDKVRESQFITDKTGDYWTNFGFHSLMRAKNIMGLMENAYKVKRKSAGERVNAEIEALRESNTEPSFFRGISTVGTYGRE